jgi:hypothetical protein
MFKVFAYLTKRDGSTSDEFIDYYENRHIALVLSLAPMPRVYKRNYLVRGDAANLESATIDFDGITEMAWDDRAGFEEWISLLGVPAIAEDEARFLDRSKTRAYVIDERVSAPSQANLPNAQWLLPPAAHHAQDTRTLARPPAPPARGAGVNSPACRR